MEGERERESFGLSEHEMFRLRWGDDRCGVCTEV